MNMPSWNNCTLRQTEFGQLMLGGVVGGVLGVGGAAGLEARCGCSVDAAWLKRIGIPAWHEDRRQFSEREPTIERARRGYHSLTRFESDAGRWALGAAHWAPWDSSVGLG
jgi:hypothetical protein